MSTPDKRIGVVGVPGKWSTESLADAIEAATGFRLVIDITRVTLDLNTRSLWYGTTNLCELDALIIKKISSVYSPETLERLDLLRVAESAGVRCFSSVGNVHRLVDRLSCTVALSNAGIPMPETTVTERMDAAQAAVKRYGQAVFKPMFSTKARGMMLLSADAEEAELNQSIAEFHRQNPLMYIQRRLDLGGEDHGLVFLGENYLCAYSRIAGKGTWNTTINSGGRYRAFEPAPEVIEVARRARDVFDLDYTTVDIAITPAGPAVFEVSAFGGFRGVTEGVGIPAAERYVEYVLGVLDAKP